MLEIGFGGIVEIMDFYGKARYVERYAFHIQAPWRLLLDKRILIASRDVYEPKTAEEWTEDFEWDIVGTTLFDELNEARVKELCNRIFLKEVLLDEYGGMRMVFDSGHTLEVFADSSNPDTELWRFFEMDSEDSHFVVYVDRVEK